MEDESSVSTYESTSSHIVIDISNTTALFVEPESIENNSIFENNYYNNIFENNPNYRSNSPVSISNYGSREGSPDCSIHGSDDNQSDSDYNDPFRESFLHPAITTTLVTSIDAKKFRQLGYNDTMQMIDKYYEHTLENKFSNEIDILTTYLKGQKHLYIQAKHFTQWKLNCLMFPTLFLTAFITIISPFIECNHWSTGFISGINAVIALFITMINYLKLESHIEVYMQRANHFDKLETSLEFANNKLSFLSKEQDKTKLVLIKIKEVEKKMAEMKDASIILIPEEIKTLFPIICNINIFSFIKKMELYKKNLIIKFKDVKNEIRYILYKMNSNRPVFTDLSSQEIQLYKHNHDTLEENRQKNRLMFLYSIKEKLKGEIFDYMSAYSQIDSIFSKEIKMADTKKNGWGFCFVCFWKSNPIKTKELEGISPIINKYFQFIFDE